jgi:two-component system, NarL family, sensor histidine kinase UhpB
MSGQQQTPTMLRVLIIEDCEDDAVLLERELTKGGYHPAVRRVDSPGTMHTALREQTWDLVLSDWNLPRFSASFALEMMKCHGLDIPFIIVSGTIDEEVAIGAMKAGAHDYVMKSNLSRLVPVTRREIGEAEARRAKKQAEEALAAVEERMKLVARATHDTIWDLDLTTQMLEWSDGVQQFFGYRPHEMQPGVESWYGCLHPAERDRVIETRYAVINGTETTWSDQYRFRRADGAYAYVLDRGYVLRNEQGRAIRAVGALIDLTEQKRAEGEIAAAYERLRDLTGRMELAKEEERKRIARELHDEFGQMLTGLKLDLSSLSRDLAKAGGASARLISRLQTMAESVDDGIHLVRKVASSLRPSVLDDLGLIPALQWQVREFEVRAGIPCVFELSERLAEREFEPDQATALFRVAQELLTNVMRHARATHAGLVFCEDKDGVLLQVTDNGCGIQEKDHVKPTTLGLRGMEERVAMHGGRLLITGEPHKGTTVKVWMPQKSRHEQYHIQSAA